MFAECSRMFFVNIRNLTQVLTNSVWTVQKIVIFTPMSENNEVSSVIDIAPVRRWGPYVAAHCVANVILLISKVVFRL